MSSSSPWSGLKTRTLTEETMAYSRKVYKGTDEDLGKESDYQHATNVDSDAFDLLTWLRLLPRRPRRILLAVVALVLLVLFIHHLPTNFPPVPERINRFPIPDQNVVVRPPHSPPGSEAQAPLPANGHHPNGPIKFYALSKSLYFTNGQKEIYGEDNVVLFAAADLKCASDLLNLACEMARNKVNQVHFALMGRDTVSVEGIQEVNGIRKAACPVIWHGKLSVDFFLALKSMLTCCKMAARTMSVHPLMHAWS